MSSPTVAILVRTKDRPRFLSRTLENIAQQTFTDYTVCVINDGGDEQAARAVIEDSPLDSGHVQLLTAAGGNMEAASNAGLTATVHAARDLFTETSLTAGFEWAMSDRAHSWDAEHRRQLEHACAIGGGHSTQGIHGAHGAEETHPVTVEPESSSEAPAQPHPAQPGLLARVARRLRS